MSAKVKHVTLWELARAGLLSICAIWSLSAPALAQKDAAKGLDKTAVMGILRSGTIPPDQAKPFEEYFTKSFLPQFATSAPSPTDKLYRLRAQLRAFQVMGRSGKAHDEVNRLTLAKMKEIAVKSPDSAARINAMYVIAELNENDEPNKIKPLAENFGLLWSVAQKGRDELKVPALIGVERFADKNSIPANKKDAVSKFMLELVNQSTPPGTRTPSGHDWMRRLAGQILVKLGAPGSTDAVLKAFQAIAADPKARPMVRCEMLQLTGQLKYPPASKADLKAIASSIGYNAIDICNQEIDQAKAGNRNPSIRLIMYSLYCAREGLSGLQTSAADTPHKKAVADAFNKVKSIHAELDDPDLNEDRLAADLGQKLKDLQAVLGPPTAAKEEVATTDPKGSPKASVKQ
ncbi:MAG TPA: hypothetical protein VGJ16_00960 [Pirellulales bacterium]|jgi:hypothetical protein